MTDILPTKISTAFSLMELVAFRSIFNDSMKCFWDFNNNKSASVLVLARYLAEDKPSAETTVTPIQTPGINSKLP